MRKEYQPKAAKYKMIFRNTVLQGLIVRYLIVLCFIVMCTWSFYGMRTIEAINYNIIKLLISDDTSLPVFVMKSFVEGKSYTTFIMADPARNLVRAAWKWGQRRVVSVVVYNTSTATSAENGKYSGQFKRFKCNSSYGKQYSQRFSTWTKTWGVEKLRTKILAEMSQRHRERFEDKSRASETSVRVHTEGQGQTDHRSRST